MYICKTLCYIYSLAIIGKNVVCRSEHLWLLLHFIQPVEAWLIPQPREYVWVTLPHALRQDHLCLSTAATDDPLLTCLVKIPFQPSEFPPSLIDVQRKRNALGAPYWVFYRGGSTYKLQLPATKPLTLWSDWVEHLPKLDKEPQEFKIWDPLLHLFVYSLIMSPIIGKTILIQFWNKKSLLTPVGVPPSQKLVGPRPKIVMPVGCIKKYLWSVVIGHELASPLTFLELHAPWCSTCLIAPNMTQIIDWGQQNKSGVQKRGACQFDEHCESEILHWSKSKRIPVSGFLPWASAAKAPDELGHLECWVTRLQIWHQPPSVTS